MFFVGRGMLRVFVCLPVQMVNSADKPRKYGIYEKIDEWLTFLYDLNQVKNNNGMHSN